MSVTRRTYMVTGGAGFLGRYVVNELNARGKQTVVPRSRHYDLRRQADVEKLFQKVQPHVVVHLAAVVGGIGANRSNPGKFFYDNMAMGIEVIEACRIYAVENLVVVGTACAYPKFPPAKGWLVESFLWSGYPEETNAPYGIAKRALETQMDAYYQQYKMQGTYLIPTNLYGPFDNIDPDTSHVIPAIIHKVQMAMLHHKKVITLWGTGGPTRDFLYVKDAAQAIATAAETPRQPRPINLSTGNSISIKQLVTLICELMGYEYAVDWDTSKPDGQPLRCLDPKVAKAMLGWNATTSLEDGLTATIQWYRDTYSEWKDEPRRGSIYQPPS